VEFMLEELDHGLNEGNACYGRDFRERRAMMPIPVSTCIMSTRDRDSMAGGRSMPAGRFMADWDGMGLGSGDRRRFRSSAGTVGHCRHRRCAMTFYRHRLLFCRGRWLGPGFKHVLLQPRHLIGTTPRQEQHQDPKDNRPPENAPPPE